MPAGLSTVAAPGNRCGHFSCARLGQCPARSIGGSPTGPISPGWRTPFMVKTRRAAGSRQVRVQTADHHTITTIRADQTPTVPECLCGAVRQYGGRPTGHPKGALMQQPTSSVYKSLTWLLLLVVIGLYALHLWHSGGLKDNLASHKTALSESAPAPDGGQVRPRQGGADRARAARRHRATQGDPPGRGAGPQRSHRRGDPDHAGAQGGDGEPARPGQRGTGRRAAQGIRRLRRASGPLRRRHPAHRRARVPRSRACTRPRSPPPPSTRRTWRPRPSSIRPSSRRWRGRQTPASPTCAPPWRGATQTAPRCSPGSSRSWMPATRPSPPWRPPRPNWASAYGRQSDHRAEDPGDGGPRPRGRGTPGDPDPDPRRTSELQTRHDTAMDKATMDIAALNAKHDAAVDQAAKQRPTSRPATPRPSTRPPRTPPPSRPRSRATWPRPRPPMPTSSARPTAASRP